MQTDLHNPQLRIGDHFIYGQQRIEVKEIKITKDGIVYNEKYVQGASGLNQLASSLQVRIAYAYERLRDGRIEKYTREWGGNQYVRRTPEFDEFSDNKGKKQ